MSIVIGVQNFIKLYQNVQRIGPVSPFSEFEPRQNLDQSQMPFDYLMGCILSVSMCMQIFITTFHSVQEIGLFSPFSKFIKIFHSVQEIGLFSLFQNLNLGKHRPIQNDIWQFRGLHLVNINGYAGLYQNIPNGLRVIDIFHEKAGDKNLHKQAVDKIKCLIIGHTMKVNLQFQLTVLGSCNISKPNTFSTWCHL